MRAIGPSSSKVIKLVMPLLNDIAKSLGLSIWDARFLKEGKNWILRIFIDKPDGVSINDCEDFSRAIDGPLDELDPIDHPYLLEVCSPGIERDLTKLEHFQRCIGLDVRLKTIRPLPDGNKEINAKLFSYNNGKITLEFDTGEIFVIDEKLVSSIKAIF